MKNRLSFNVLVVASALCFGLGSCLKTNVTPATVPNAEDVLKANIASVDKARLAADLKIIDDSLQKKSITPLIDTYGSRYTIETQGPGEFPTLTSLVRVKYKGMLLSNKAVFDQSNDATFPLSNLIVGWQTTLPLLTKGTKATLYIPSGYGYGPQPATDGKGNVVIPANSNLIFEIELLDIQ